jgi:hypothetical protein
MKLLDLVWIDEITSLGGEIASFAKKSVDDFAKKSVVR